MFLTADTIDKIYRLCQKDIIYEEILRKFFSNTETRNEFRQFLWEQICTQPREKIIDVWNRREFKYLYARIISNQVRSNHSEWYKQRHPEKHYSFIEDYNSFHQIKDEDIDPEALSELNQYKISLIKEALDFYSSRDPYFFIDRKLFEEYYFNKKPFRQLKEESTLINGQKLSIHTVQQAVQYATLMVKKYIKKYKRDSVGQA